MTASELKQIILDARPVVNPRTASNAQIAIGSFCDRVIILLNKQIYASRSTPKKNTSKSLKKVGRVAKKKQPRINKSK